MSDDPKDEKPPSGWSAVLLQPLLRYQDIELDDEGRVPGSFKIAVGPPNIVNRPKLTFVPISLDPTEKVAFYVDVRALAPLVTEDSQILQPSGADPLPPNVVRMNGGKRN